MTFNDVLYGIGILALWLRAHTSLHISLVLLLFILFLRGNVYVFYPPEIQLLGRKDSPVSKALVIQEQRPEFGSQELP